MPVPSPAAHRRQEPHLVLIGEHGPGRDPLAVDREPGTRGDAGEGGTRADRLPQGRGGRARSDLLLGRGAPAALAERGEVEGVHSHAITVRPRAVRRRTSATIRSIPTATSATSEATRNPVAQPI